MKLDFFFSVLLVISQYVGAQYQYGDIRLVGSSYQWEGRVEIYKSERWGTITDTQWSSDEAQVVCRKLGLFKPGAVPQPNAYFGEGSGPIHTDYISCTGTEYDLTDCATRNSSRQSNHSEDVGVQCQPADGSYREGDIRLVGGTHDWEGRVEIYMAGTWGTVSDDDWTEDDAQVVCRQLSFPITGAVAQCCTHYGGGIGPVHVQNVSCLGSEPSITECSHSDTPGMSHGSDVGVQCQPRAIAVRDGTIRLVVGHHPWEGRVEIYLSGTWGTISVTYGQLTRGALVVCRQLGYSGDGVYASTYYYHFPTATGPIAMRLSMCSGNEYRLTNCTYDLDTNISSHSNDWAVMCSPGSPQEGDLHLSDDLVEVFVSGEWGTVSSDGWTRANSEVACRQAGYTLQDTFSSLYHYSGRPQLIGTVTCTGSESKLVDCPHTTADREAPFLSDVLVYCQHDNCFAGDIRLVGGHTETEGRVEMCSQFGSWWTMCDKQWSPSYTKIACRHVGFAEEGISFNSSVFGRGAGPIFAGYLNCIGSESSILYCPHFLHSYTGCTHNNDVGIRCEPAACGDGELRLWDRRQLDRASGILQVCFDRRWGLIQSFYSSVHVPCHQMGYSGGDSSVFSSNVPAVPVYLIHVDCIGNESNILECSYDKNTDGNTDLRSYGYRITCYPSSCNNGELRLTEADVEWEGRLEVCLNQRWGTVSDDGWSEDNAQVVCRDLGYEIEPSEYVYYRPWHSSVSLPIYIHNVVCSGTEGSLLHCSNSSGSIYNHSRDVGVKCQRTSCSDGDVRLMDGENRNEGYVQVCFNQRWGTIYDDGWGIEETKVICRQLGYPTQGFFDYSDDSGYMISSPIYLNAVDCNGQEQKITDCSYGRNTTSHIHHYNDVTVRCPPSPDTSSTEPPSPSSTDSTYTLSDIYPTANRTARPSSPDVSTSDHEYPSEGAGCSVSVSSRNDSESPTTDKNDSKFTAVLIFAIVSWVITGLSLAVAVGTIIHYRKKKDNKYDQMQLQNKGSNDSLTGMVDAEGMEPVQGLLTVGKTAVL